MNKVYNVGGILVHAVYYRKYHETFLHPANALGRWRAGEFEHVCNLVTQNGWAVVGGHEYYVPVAGNLLKTTHKNA